MSDDKIERLHHDGRAPRDMVIHCATDGCDGTAVLSAGDVIPEAWWCPLCGRDAEIDRLRGEIDRLRPVVEATVFLACDDVPTVAAVQRMAAEALWGDLDDD
jgi:hypothetical protein